MLFFRSEEHVRRWCEARGVPVRPLLTIPQLWALASVWHGARLRPEWRRFRPDEVRGIFAGLGLESDFWDPTVSS
jgi:hypothetical protein